MIERLPTPWGLVRLGVAPDHPKPETVSRAFERIAAKTRLSVPRKHRGGARPAPRRSGAAVAPRSTRSAAQTDRKLGIPARIFPGSWSAFELVAWYNGHPDYQDLSFDLDVERAVVIGNGNVALDVARMLALTPEELAPTDTTDRAIDAIASSRIADVVTLGRRGPAQAAFTPVELAEMGELAGADVVVDPAELELDAATSAQAEADTRVRRNMDILRGFAARTPTGKPRTVRLRFLVSPVAVLGEGRVEAVEIVRNRLEARDGRTVAVPTDEREIIPCGLVFRSVGYHGVELPGVPFDAARGTIRNDCGRVLDDDGRT